MTPLHEGIRRDLPMTIEIIGAIAFLLGIISFFYKPIFIVTVFMISTQLGAASAFKLDELGGTAISPSHLLLIFVLIRLFGTPACSPPPPERGFSKSRLLATRNADLQHLRSDDPAPDFMGSVKVYAVRATSNLPEPLASSIGNFTQSAFFFADVLCFFVFVAYLRRPQQRMAFASIVLMCIIINLAFALLDLITYWTNTTELLSFIRNSNYRMLADTEVAGFKRIVGSYTEASSFGAVTLSHFAYSLYLWLHGIKPRLSATLTVCCFIALLFSTSSTAYVGVAALFLLLYLQSFYRFIVRSVPRQTVIFLFVVPPALILGVCLLAMNDDSWRYVSGLADTILLNKMETDSGIERASWTQQAFQNFFDTFGLGVGNGSMRSASFLAAVAGSLGVVGTFFYSAFFFKVLVSDKTPAPDELTINASRILCATSLITASVSGGFIDLGVPFYVFAALASSGSSVSAKSFYRASAVRLAPRA